MNEIHLKYRDRGLVVIGQDVWEETPAEAEKFVKMMGSKMTYRVALDDGNRDGTMAKTWLTASGQQGIPSAILVGKDGRVAWIGYGMEHRRRSRAVLSLRPANCPAPSMPSSYGSQIPGVANSTA